MSALDELSASTTASLQALFGELGLESAEQQALLRALSDSVRDVFASAVTAQQSRAAAAEANIADLRALIASLQRAMDEPEDVVSSATASRRRAAPRARRRRRHRLARRCLPNSLTLPAPPPFAHLRGRTFTLPPHNLQPARNGKALLPYVAQLEAKRAATQETWDARHAALKEHEASLRALSADVGAPVREAFAAIGDRISTARVAAFAAEVEAVAALKAERAAAVSALCTEIGALWAELGASSGAAAAPRDETDACVARGGEGLGWTTGAIAELQRRCGALQAEKAAREERIMVIGQQITALWKRLATPEAEQTAFLERHAGIGDDVIEACEAYLATKKAEFAARLVDLVAQARASISALWDELRLGAQQREEAFADFFTPPAGFSDDLFAAHEAYIVTASAQLEEARPILRAIEKRTAILGERAEYEALMADPQRLLAKGSSSARLREEKLERRVKKELPAVTKKLRAQVLEWEAAHGGAPLTIDGTRYIAVLDSEEAADAQAAKEARANRHKGGDAADGGADSAAAGAPAPAAPPTAQASRSTSAPSQRMSVIFAKTGAGAAAPPAAAARPKQPVGMKKTSVPASLGATSAAVAPAAADEDDGASAVSSFVAAPKPAATRALAPSATNAAAAARPAAAKAAPAAEPPPMPTAAATVL